MSGYIASPLHQELSGQPDLALKHSHPGRHSGFPCSLQNAKHTNDCLPDLPTLLLYPDTSSWPLPATLHILTALLLERCPGPIPPIAKAHLPIFSSKTLALSKLLFLNHLFCPLGQNLLLSVNLPLWKIKIVLIQPQPSVGQ